MKYLTTTTYLVATLLLISCGQNPVPIDYGADGCHFCRMTIVDERFGAEIVTKKGKPLKFDAIECMINHLHQVEGPTDQYLVLISDYVNPGGLIDAKQGYYLHSKNVPSPMGMYLSGYEDKTAAEEKAKEQGGTVYTWPQLVNGFRTLSDTSAEKVNR